MINHALYCVIWACRSGREEFEIFDWLGVDSWKQQGAKT
jgi:hypothetical protein